MKFTSLISSAILAHSAIAHPGQSAEEHAQEIAERNAYMSTAKRSLAHCAEALRARGNDVYMHARRAAQVETMRAERGIAADAPYLRARSIDSVNTDHQSNLTGITPNTDSSILFAGNSSCILAPEVTQGPYWVKGELIRKDITGGQTGVPLTLDLQVIDVKTCKPVPNAYIEIWHANSTGVYSGVVAQGNGNSNDASNINATAYRGLQKSDSNGVVQFTTHFPGHYTGRATHMHVMSTLNATLNANNTLSGGSISHVGQTFFDQDLISSIDKISPYSSNKQQITLNSADSILTQEAADIDPFVEYVLLGNSLSEGIFGWTAFGIDTSKSYSINPAATLTDHGGVANSNSGSGGPGGSPSGGSPSSGSPSSGSPRSGSASSRNPSGTPNSVPSGFPGGAPSGFPGGAPGGSPSATPRA